MEGRKAASCSLSGGQSWRYQEQPLNLQSRCVWRWELTLISVSITRPQNRPVRDEAEGWAMLSQVELVLLCPRAQEPGSNKLLCDGEAGSSPCSVDHTQRTPASRAPAPASVTLGPQDES